MLATGQVFRPASNCLHSGGNYAGKPLTPVASPLAMGKVTINDVAALAGVSKKTVSHVVNGIGRVAPATRERVEAAVAQLGFVPSPQARAFAAGHSSLVVLVHDGSDDPPLATLLAGLEEGLAPAGLVAGVHTGGDAGALARLIAAQRPRAVLLAPPLSADPDLLRACAEADCQAVRLAPEPVEGAGLWVDERQAAADAAGWLVALGHRRIGFIAGPEDDRRARARELGFIDAQAEQGLERGAEIVAQGDFTLTSGEDATRLLLEVSPRPTAILAANDAMAAGALRTLSAARLDVPGDISVMGLGDAPLAAALTPPLATMSLPWRDLARLAAARIVDPGAPVPPALPARLIPRASVGPAGD